MHLNWTNLSMQAVEFELPGADSDRRILLFNCTGYQFLSLISINYIKHSEQGRRHEGNPGRAGMAFFIDTASTRKFCKYASLNPFIGLISA